MKKVFQIFLAMALLLLAVVTSLDVNKNPEKYKHNLLRSRRSASRNSYYYYDNRGHGYPYNSRHYSNRHYHHHHHRPPCGPFRRHACHPGLRAATVVGGAAFGGALIGAGLANG